MSTIACMSAFIQACQEDIARSFRGFLPISCSGETIACDASSRTTEMMKQLGQRFAQFINRVHGRTGALWEGRFYSCVVDSGAYLFTCHRYIELNPVRARMVRRPEEFVWSSYRTNANGEESAIVSPHPQYLALAKDVGDRLRWYRLSFDMSLDDGASDEIRKMTRGGYAFGSDGFKARMAALSGRPMSPQKRGPKEVCPETPGFGSDP
jgi:putative transposase